MLPITQDLIKVNFTKRTNKVNEWIVIHYFGGLGSDESVVNYFDRDATNASAGYALDDDSITQAVLDKDTAWHCGDSGRGTYKDKCFNANSIGIEVRPYKINTSHISASDNDWYFHETTVNNLIDLVIYLMKEHNIPLDHVIRHYDVTAKLCPRPWVGDDINIYYGKTGNQLWNEFKQKLADRLEDEEVIRYNKLSDIPEANGFRETIETLMNAQIIKGDGSDVTGNNDVIDLSHDQVRSLIFEYRGGAFDKKLIAMGMTPAVQ